MAENQRRSLGSSQMKQNNSPNYYSYGADDDAEMLVEDMQHAVSQTKGKIGTLRQALSEKNQVIRRERALRRAAERRELDKSTEATFVDIYAGSSPSVNEDLKDWLSPSKQRDRLLRGGKAHPKEKELQKLKEQSPKASKGVDQPDGVGESDSLLSSEEEEDMRSEEGEEAQGRQERRPKKPRKKPRARDDYNIGTHPNWNPNFTMPPAGGPWYPPGMPGLMYQSPVSPWVSPHRVHPDPQGQWLSMGPGYGQFAHSEPNLSSGPPPVRRHSDVGQAFSNVAQSSSPEEKNMSSQRKEAASQGSPSSAVEQPIAQSTSPPVRIVVERGTNARTDFEEGVPLLLSELGSTRDVNKELQERLLDTEQEIDSLRLTQSLTEATLEARIAARAAAVVEEIYAAQKDRDAAIMARLRLANEERDESLTRLRRMESKDDFDSGTDLDDEFGTTEMSMNDLLARLSVADNGPEISKYGQSILSQISKVKSSKGRIVAEEMRAIIHERDAAQAKCKKLEREIIELRRTTGGLAVRNNNEQSLRSQLEATRQERDTAVTKVRKLQEDLEEVKVFYSLHKSLSQEADLRDQFNSTIGSFEEEAQMRSQALVQMQKSNGQLNAQLKQQQNERNAMAAQLQQALHAQQNSQTKLKEQERLISVLRKKVAEGTVKIVN